MEHDLEKYYEFLVTNKKCSDNTLESYQRDLRQFQNYVLDKNISYLEYDEGNIVDYLEELKKIGKKDSTRARVLASIKGFYIYLISNRKMKYTSIVTMQNVNVKKKNVTEDELKNQENKIKYILNMKFEDSPKGIRDKAILEMTYNTNIKATQLISLQLSDYDSKNRIMKVDGRKISLTNSICDALDKYLNYSRSILVMYKDIQELFVNIKGSKMTRQGYWKIIKLYENQYDENSDVIINNKIYEREFEDEIAQISVEKEEHEISKKMVNKEETLDKISQKDIVSDFILRCMYERKKED